MSWEGKGSVTGIAVEVDHIMSELERAVQAWSREEGSVAYLNRRAPISLGTVGLFYRKNVVKVRFEFVVDHEWQSTRLRDFLDKTVTLMS